MDRWAPKLGGRYKDSDRGRDNTKKGLTAQAQRDRGELLQDVPAIVTALLRQHQTRWEMACPRSRWSQHPENPSVQYIWLSLTCSLQSLCHLHDGRAWDIEWLLWPCRLHGEGQVLLSKSQTLYLLYTAFPTCIESHHCASFWE